MKKYIGILAIVTGLASIQSHAATQALCKEVDLSGRFQSSPDGNDEVHTLDVKQNGCRVSVVESWADNRKQLKTANWQFDLSYEEAFKLPPAVLEANSDGELATKSMKSFSGGTKLRKAYEGYYGGYVVDVNVQIKLPAAERNKIESSLAIKGYIELSCDYYAPNPRPCRVNFMNVNFQRARVISAKVPFESAFRAGANYILGFVDNMNLIGIVAPQIQTFTRK